MKFRCFFAAQQSLLQLLIIVMTTALLLPTSSGAGGSSARTLAAFSVPSTTVLPKDLPAALVLPSSVPTTTTRQLPQRKQQKRRPQRQRQQQQQSQNGIKLHQEQCRLLARQIPNLSLQQALFRLEALKDDGMTMITKRQHEEEEEHDAAAASAAIEPAAVAALRLCCRQVSSNNEEEGHRAAAAESDVANRIFPSICSTDACRRAYVQFLRKSGAADFESVVQCLGMDLPIATTPSSISRNDRSCSEAVRQSDDDVRNIGRKSRISATTSIGTLNAAMAAAPTGNDALRLLNLCRNHTGDTKNDPTSEEARGAGAGPPVPSLLTYNICLQRLGQTKGTCGQQGGGVGQQAQDLFDAMPMKPDRISYQNTMAAWIRSGRHDRAHELLLSYEDDGGLASPTRAELYDILICSYGKTQDWETVRKLEKEKIGENISNGIIDRLPSFARWTCVEKFKYKDAAYWKLGSYDGDSANGSSQNRCSWTVAVTPHRNPSSNGLQIVFFETGSTEEIDAQQDSPPLMKVAHLLMKAHEENVEVSHTGSEGNEEIMRYGGIASLLGVHIDPSYRKSGNSKRMLGMWIDLCLQAGLFPQTGILRKPLLCLVLQNTFGFQPVNPNEGIDVEILSRPDGDSHPLSRIQLYSPNKCLEGAFSPGNLKRQGIELCRTRPSGCGIGRLIRVNARLQWSGRGCVSPITASSPLSTLSSSSASNSVEPNQTNLSHRLTQEQLRAIFLGKES